MVELDFLAKASRLSLEDAIVRLRDAGLDSCPGGGAEIFARGSASRSATTRPTADAGSKSPERSTWQASVRTAPCSTATSRPPPNASITSSSCVELQDETGGFQCLIPLAFHPENTELDHLPPTGGRLDLQTIAVSRLVLDNVPHLKAYWIMLGEKVAQVALAFGANDLDGTIVDERITHAAGGTAGTGMARQRLEELITEAGRVPVLRDTLYRPIEVETIVA